MRCTRSIRSALPFGVLIAALAAPCAGCSSEAQVDCDDDDPPVAPAAPETALIRSQIKLTDDDFVLFE